MKRCDQDQRLTPFLLGDLPGLEADSVRQHLTQCAACQATVRRLEPTLTALRSALARDASANPQLAPARRARLLAIRPQRHSRVIRWIARPRAWLPIAAGLIVGLGASILYVAMGPGVYQARALFEMNARPGWTTKASPACMDAGWEGEISERATETLREPEKPAYQSVLGGNALFGNVNGLPTVSDVRALRENKPGQAAREDARPPISAPASNREGERPREPRPSDPRSGSDGDPFGVADDGLATANVRGLVRAAKPKLAPEPVAPADHARDSVGWHEENRKQRQAAAAASSVSGPTPGAQSESAVRNELFFSYGDVAAAADQAAPPATSPPMLDRPTPRKAEVLRKESGEALGFDAVQTDRLQFQSGAPTASAAREDARAPSLAVKSPVTMRGIYPSTVSGAYRPAPQRPDSLTGTGRKDAKDRVEADTDGDIQVTSNEDETYVKRDMTKRRVAGERLTSEQQTIQRMKEIVVPEINFRNANMQDVARFLSEASKKQAHGKDKGIAFESRGYSETTAEPMASLPGDRAYTKTDADPFAGAAPANEGAPVTVTMRQVSLLDAAKIVADAGGMKFRVKDDKVVFLPANEPYDDMVTKNYSITPALAERLGDGLKESASADATVDWTPFFSKMGVSWPAAASAIYDKKTRKLRVSNTAERLTEFEQVLLELNGPPAPRVPAAFNPFVDTAAERFSTFSIDVDTASYTLTRQAIHAGRLPDPEVVRTEEIVNAFDYGDAAPDRATFRVYIEGAPSPFGPDLTLLRIGVKGRRLGREEQRAAMLTFLIDTSGSMSQPDRIGLARTSLKLLLENLAPIDRIQIVAYDDRARVVLDPTPATEAAAVLAAFDALQCTGSTNLEDGMRKAYELAARAFLPGAENRVILVSDGVANLGAGDASEILSQIDTYRRQGITCSVFGVGKGTYNDQMLEQLANKGDGIYRFLDSEEEARRAFVDDLAATLNTIAADVKIQVEWNPAAVRRYRQLGYENRALTKEQFRDDTVDAGEVGSGQSVTALYELEPVADSAARRLSLGTVRIRYRRMDTRVIEEIESPILPEMIARNIEACRPQFRLAVGAAEFAEILRASPYAVGSRFDSVAALLRPVALALPLDTRVRELLDLAEQAETMSK